MELFGSLLARLLRERGISQRKYASLVGVHHTLINKVAGNLRQPAWSRADAWADALELRGPEREHFLDAMHLAAASPRVRAMVERLQSNRNSNR